MLKVKCTQKFRGKNNIIIGYRIMDQNGNTKDVYSESLKQVIKQGKLEVINLTLTSDNRLIDKAITQTPTQQAQTQQKLIQQTQKPVKQSPQKAIDINGMLSKLKLLGCVTEIDKGCDHKIYLAKMSGEDYILVIPDDVTKIKFDCSYGALTPINKIPIKSSNAKLTVYGGNNLKIVGSLFSGTEFSTIDLSKFNTSKVTDMQYMFSECRATSIDLSNFDTSNVTNMECMFCECQATSLDLSSFDTSKVTNMSTMFYGCKAASLDLSKFNTSNVTNMEDMFSECQATSIDLSKFDTSKVTSMKAMFYGCKATSIDLSSFDTSKVTNMVDMFSECQATSINFGGNKDLESAWNKR